MTTSLYRTMTIIIKINTTLACTIPAGLTKGVGTDSVAFTSGDLLDVKTPASGTPGKPGSFSVSTG